MVSQFSLIKVKPSQKSVRIILVLWVMLVAGGFGILESYANTAGKGANAPATLAVGDHRPTLRVFVHPECPCSRATLVELSHLQSEFGEKLKTVVEVFSPQSMSRQWAKGNLYLQAAGIPGIDVELDRDGQQAHKFGVFTSGQVLLYSGDGKLVFSGGLTASRGHEGSSVGSDSIRGFLRDGRTSVASSPVFGCALGAR